MRVYNPILEDDGWECPHTVIEIVTEDMSFLVDSVRMAVNRRDLKLLRIIHPIVALRRDGDAVGDRPRRVRSTHHGNTLRKEPVGHS